MLETFSKLMKNNFKKKSQRFVKLSNFFAMRLRRNKSITKTKIRIRLKNKTKSNSLSI
jgi:hypothetical protein